jgi:catechol 2,3-dioxygenase-like lactoylglutathione lyase family enzyme
MLKQEKIFSSFSVDNLEQGKEFYVKVLGLEVKENSMGFIELVIPGSNNVLIYPKEDHRPADFTVLNFPVNDIDETVDLLIKKGIRFEHYKGSIQTDQKGISRADEMGPDIAWFTDPAGNILSVLAI